MATGDGNTVKGGMPKGSRGRSLTDTCGVARVIGGGSLVILTLAGFVLHVTVHISAYYYECMKC